MITAVEVFDLYESHWSGDEYETPKDVHLSTFRRRYLAEREKERLEQDSERNKRWANVYYYIDTRLVRPDKASEFQRRPANFLHLEDVIAANDVCGFIRELVGSANVKLAHTSIEGQAGKHKHPFEEFYFVVKGEGHFTIDDEKYFVEQGDSVYIPPNAWHFLETNEDQTLETLVITHPPYDSEKVTVDDSRTLNYPQ